MASVVKYNKNGITALLCEILHQKRWGLPRMTLAMFISVFSIFGDEPTQFKDLDKMVSELELQSSSLMDSIFSNIPLTNDDAEKIKRILNRLCATDTKLLNEYMIARLNYERYKGDNNRFANPANVIGCMNYFYPKKGFDWIFDNYSKLNPLGRIHLMNTFTGIENAKEPYELKIIFMDDKEWYQRTKGEGRTIERVCNSAYSSIISDLEFSSKSKILYPHTRLQTDPYAPFEFWDKNIQMFKEWWLTHAEELLKYKKTIYPDQEEFKRKCGKLREYIRQNPVKEYEYSGFSKAEHMRKIDYFNRIENMTEEEYKAYSKEK